MSRRIEEPFQEFKRKELNKVFNQDCSCLFMSRNLSDDEM